MTQARHFVPANKGINRFDSLNYYFKNEAYREEKSGKKLNVVLLTKMGTELVAQYYREKYGCDITVFDDSDNLIKHLTTTQISENTRKAYI